MKSRSLEYKIELLQKCSCSKDIYDSLDDIVSQYYHECDEDSFAVNGEPWAGPWEIEQHIELLSDLRLYTECIRTDQKIPDDLLYLVNFCKNIE